MHRYSERIHVRVSAPATVQWYTPLQLALIKSHLAAFDSEVPVSPLSNLSFARLQAKSKASTAAVISIPFLSEITSRKNTEPNAPQSKQSTTLLWLNAVDLYFLLLNS